MIPASAKMIMTALLSLAAIALFVFLGGRSRKECMLAMLISTVGDIFMVDGVINWEFGPVIGAAAFIVAHFVYAGCFRKNIAECGYEYKNKGFKLGLAIMILSAVVLGVLAFTVPEKPVTLMYFAILIYIAVIGYNLCTQFSFAFSAKGLYYILPFAITLFYATDIFIFHDMLNIEHISRNFVWYGYPLAQMLIVLFNAPLKKQK